MPPLDPHYLTLARECARTGVAGGFADREEIVWVAVETVLDEAQDAGEELPRDAIEPAVEVCVDEALREHQRRQAEWPAVTDCDRLTSAFAELDRSGIVAREHFSCCTNCGIGEIGEEIERFDGRPRGFTFFHSQDTEGAAESGFPIHLSYGTVEPGGDPVAVGHEVVAALRRHGLSPAWDGSITRKIELPLDWRRRRTP